MSTTIELPQVGESVTEGVIGKWLKQPGDRVEKYDALVEVMTDKVNMEVPSPFTGTLSKVLVNEGDTVPMGAAIAEMDVEGGGHEQASVRGEALEPRAGQEPVHPSRASGRTEEEASASGRTGEAGSAPIVSETPQHASFEFVESVRSVGPTGSGEGGEGRPDADADGQAPVHPELVEEASASGRTGGLAGSPRAEERADGQRLSPLVRRLAQEHGVDVSQVRGSGLGGRVTKEDVLWFVEEGGGSAHPSSASGRTGGSTSSPRAEENAGVDEIEEPLTPLRKIIADNMTRSASEIPSAWSMVEVDVSGLVACRDAHKGAFQKQSGASLTYLPFVVKAAAEALREFPRLNSRWGGDRIFLKQRVNIGVAVATDNGLVVPVVHDADGMTVAGLASSVHDLAERARQGALKLEDVQNGTFTVNNTGALGSVVSYPIINHPQAAILTTEAIVKRPMVMAGDVIAVRSMMNVAFAFDHRICDGAEAGGFLASVKRRLEAITADTVID